MPESYARLGWESCVLTGSSSWVEEWSVQKKRQLGGWRGRGCDSAYFFGALKQDFMNVLRSSPFLPAASVLHAFILSCCVMAMAGAGLALRHSFMNALRSSPFLPLASALQAAIFDCWLLAALGASAAIAVLQQRANRVAVILAVSVVFMAHPFDRRG